MRALVWLVDVYQYVLIAHVIASWIPEARRHPIGQLLDRVCAPLLNPIRRFLQRVLPSTGSVDLSPILGFFALSLLKKMILSV